MPSNANPLIVERDLRWDSGLPYETCQAHPASSVADVRIELIAVCQHLQHDTPISVIGSPNLDKDLGRVAPGLPLAVLLDLSLSQSHERPPWVPPSAG